jgi:hypothetical protein
MKMIDWAGMRVLARMNGWGIVRGEERRIVM